MTRGDVVLYRCLAGHRCLAEVRAVNSDGTLDLAVDSGAGDPVELTKIALVPTGKLIPGTCAAGEA